MRRAACRGRTEMMFPFPTGLARVNVNRQQLEAEREAKKLCWSCPVLAQCAEYARRLPPETDGVFAGMSRFDRKQGVRMVAARPSKPVQSYCACGAVVEPGAKFCSITCWKEYACLTS